MAHKKELNVYGSSYFRDPFNQGVYKLNWFSWFASGVLLVGLWYCYKLISTKLNLDMAKIISSDSNNMVEASLSRSSTTLEGHLLSNVQVSCSGKDTTEAMQGVANLLALNREDKKHEVAKNE